MVEEPKQLRICRRPRLRLVIQRQPVVIPNALPRKRNPTLSLTDGTVVVSR
jgi:hypothetical protein